MFLEDLRCFVVNLLGCNLHNFLVQRTYMQSEKLKIIKVTHSHQNKKDTFQCRLYHLNIERDSTYKHPITTIIQEH